MHLKFSIFPKKYFRKMINSVKITFAKINNIVKKLIIKDYACLDSLDL